MMIFKSFAVFFLLVLQLTKFVAAKPQDKYGNPCQAALIKLNYGCEENKASKCQCQNPIFQQSAVYCVNSHTKDKIERKAAYKGLLKPCSAYLDKSTFQNVSKHLDTSKFVKVDEKHLKKILHTQPIILPESYIESYFLVNAKKLSRVDIAHKLAGGLLGYWAGVLLLKSITNLISKYAFPVLRAADTKLSRKFRRHVTLPPTFRYKHLSVQHIFSHFTFTVPVRFQTLVIVGFTILHFIFYFVEYPIIMPNYSYKNITKQITSILAYRTGIFGLSELILLLLFGGRNNFLIWITGWPLDTYNVFHRWVGRFFFIDIVMHGIVYSISSIQNHKYRGRLEKHYWRWGVAAVFIAGALMVQSLHLFRARKYEIFLALHILLAVGTVLSTWYHVALLKREMQYLYATVAVWAFDRFIRIVRIIFSGLNAQGVAKLYPDGIIKMKIRYSNRWTLRPGAYGFFHILKPSMFWQSHPFTIIESPLPEDAGKLVLLVRVKNGLTRGLQRILEEIPDRTTQLPMLVEGPYGSDHKLHNYDNVVMIAGGIGVTGVYTFATSLKKNTDPNKRFLFVWCIGSDSPLEWFEDELNYLVSDERFDVRVFISPHRSIEPDDDSSSDITDENQKEKSIQPPPMSTTKFDAFVRRDEKVDIRSAVYEEMATAKGSVAFVCCGPGSMNDDVRVTISKNLEMTKGRVDYFEESFSW